ncbi:MAG: leucine/isoleucine/valine transporter permease subunit [bacterium]|nr:leucine/isoleucine/valine transporter permease subunit [bacterium]
MTLTTREARKTLRWSVIAGLVMVFTSAVGMMESFDDRLIIYPVLSLGYLMLFWIVPLAGFQATHLPRLEGIEPPGKGLSNVLIGALTGLGAGVILAVFVVVADQFDLREVFVSISPRLVRLLTFEDTLPGGLLATVLIPTLLGTAGGAFHLLRDNLGRRLVLALEWVLVVAILEGVVAQILRQIRLDALGERIYTQRALEWFAAVALFLAILPIPASRTGTNQVERIRQRLFSIDPAQRIRNSVVSAVVILVFLILLPQLLGSLLSEVLANVGLFLIMGLGLNIVVGLAGMLDLGYVAFFAVGAYTVAVLTSSLSPRFAPELSWWLALPVALLVSALSGVMIGTPVIRMRGDYLAIVTLGFGEIIRILFLSDWLSPIFGGAQGILDIPGIPLGVTRVSGISPESILYFAFAFVLIAAWVSWSLQHSRIGRAWNALREDETVAAAMGVNTVRAKLDAFIVGAILAGGAGALFAAKLGSVFPSSFELLVSIIILVVVIVGGMGNIVGVAVGAVVLIGILGGPNVPGLMAEFAEFKLLIYGALLIFMMLRRPEGLIPARARYRELHADEADQDAWLDKSIHPIQSRPSSSETTAEPDC